MKKRNINLIALILSIPLVTAENDFSSALTYFTTSSFSSEAFSWILNSFVAVLIFLVLILLSSGYISSNYKKGNNFEIFGIILMDFFITLFLTVIFGVLVS